MTRRKSSGLTVKGFAAPEHIAVRAARRVVKIYATNNPFEVQDTGSGVRTAVTARTMRENMGLVNTREG